MPETKTTTTETAPVTSATGEQTAKTGEQAAATKPLADIIRGRMPAVIAFLIRFKENGATTSALATKYKTTVGKISDIQKVRNFSYITKDFAPTEAHKAEALAFAAGLPNNESIIKEINGLKVATEDQAKAFDALKKQSRPGRKANTETVAPPVNPEATLVTPEVVKKGTPPDLSKSK